MPTPFGDLLVCVSVIFVALLSVLSKVPLVSVWFPLVAYAIRTLLIRVGKKTGRKVRVFVEVKSLFETCGLFVQLRASWLVKF